MICLDRIRFLFHNLYNKLANAELRHICRSNYYIGTKDYACLESSVQLEPLDEHNLVDILAKKTSKKFKNKTIIAFLETLEKNMIYDGKLLDALQVRNTIHYFVQRQYKTNKKPTIQLMWSFIQQNDFVSANRICDSLFKKVRFKVNKDKLHFFSHLFFKKPEYIDGLKTFFDLGIKNKKTIVYGPLYNGESFDCNYETITIGYKGLNNKSKISFYNVEASSKINSFSSFSFFSDLNYAVFFKYQHNYQTILLKEDRFRYIYSLDFLFEYGQPNMLQNMVFHILRNEPESLYLTGFNLYLSKNIYGKNYNDFKNTSNKISEVKGSFVEHNIITQYQFMHLLYINNCFSCDECLRNIMDMGQEAFLAEMERIITEE